MENVEEVRGGRREEGKVGKGRVGKLWREERIERWFSAENVESLGKKRGIEEVEVEKDEVSSAFKRSDLTRRSPKEDKKEEGGGSMEMEEMVKGLMGELREMREEMKREREEWREERKKWREEREKWREERKKEEQKREKLENWLEKIEGEVRKVEEKLEDLTRERKEEEKEGREGRSGGDAEEEYRRRIRKLELKHDRKEREEKRNNIIIRRIQVEGKDLRGEVRRLWEVMGLKEEGIKEIGRIGKVGGDGRGMVWVKLRDREEKRKVMERRRNLAGRKERLDDDLTEEERKARWKIEREAEKERGEGKKVQIGYMKLWVNGKIRRWDEIEEGWCKVQGNEEGRRGERMERGGNRGGIRIQNNVLERRRTEEQR